MPSRLVQWMDRKLYPQFANNWDNLLLRQTILPNLRHGDRVLDLGAGSGLVKETRFRGLVDRVHGLDPDPRVLTNPHLDEARIGFGEDIPFDDATFDVVFANNVLEHLQQPRQVFKEIARVLKPGGKFFAKTPNRWHYVPTIAACTPHWFHRRVNALRGRPPEDTFPTCYLANTPAAIQELAAATGLIANHVQLIEGRPEYLRMTAPTYLAGWLYERAVNNLPGLSAFRVILIVELMKPYHAPPAKRDRIHAVVCGGPMRPARRMPARK